MVRQNEIPPAGEKRSVDELAAEFLDQISAGKRPRKEDYLPRLSDASRRDEFLEILRYAVTVESCLPRVIAAGEQLGPYLLEHEIGKGGMGRVFRATDSQLERQVAVKLLPAHQQSNDTYMRRFSLESRTLARLRHPHVVSIHEAGCVEGVHYLVMDLVEGKPLNEVIETLGHCELRPPRGLDLRAAIGREPSASAENLVDEDDYFGSITRIFLRVVRAVAAAHEQGVMHRDLKPANVMLCAGGFPVVLDFGLAGLLDQTGGSVTEGLFGTASYLAPEQIKESKVGADVRTDVYQLGMVLYELLVFQRAFPGDSISQITMKVSTGEFKRPSRVRPETPRDLEAICLKASSLDRDRRYSSAAEMAEDLERFLRHEPTIARPPSLVERSWRVLARHRAAFIVTAALILAVGSFWWKQSTDSTNLKTLRLSADGGAWEEVGEGAALYPGDRLACEAVFEEATRVWALALHGLDQTQIESIQAIPIQLATDDPANSPRSFLGRQFPAGEYVFLLAELEKELASTLTPCFGFWILQSEEDDVLLSRWMQKLWKQKEDSGEPVKLESGLEELSRMLADDRGTKPRDGSSAIASLSPEAQKKALDSLLYPKKKERRRWPFDDPKCTELYFKLARTEPITGG